MEIEILEAVLDSNLQAKEEVLDACFYTFVMHGIL